jgi:hypothetical protein
MLLYQSFPHVPVLTGTTMSALLLFLMHLSGSPYSEFRQTDHHNEARDQTHPYILLAEFHFKQSDLLDPPVSQYIHELLLLHLAI